MTALNAKTVVVFEYRARFGHFLRAEASASALSYPVPPRTALLGLIGAVLGLEKNAPQTELEFAEIALCGRAPSTHWHRAKLRKDTPPPMDKTIKKGAKGSDGSPERATLIPQEWLLEPHYTIVASLPEAHQNNFVERLEQRKWHYPPSMGLSEMTADLNFVCLTQAQAIEDGEVHCSSLVRLDQAQFNATQALNHQQALAITPLRLPRAVSANREFSHANYLLERNAQPIPIRTAQAYNLTWQEKTRAIMFL